MRSRFLTSRRSKMLSGLMHRLLDCSRIHLNLVRIRYPFGKAITPNGMEGASRHGNSRGQCARMALPADKGSVLHTSIPAAKLLHLKAQLSENRAIDGGHNSMPGLARPQGPGTDYVFGVYPWNMGDAANHCQNLLAFSRGLTQTPGLSGTWNQRVILPRLSQSQTFKIL